LKFLGATVKVYYNHICLYMEYINGKFKVKFWKMLGM